MDGYIREIRRESNVKVVNRWMDTSGRYGGKAMLKLSTDGWIRQGDKEGKQC